MSPRRSDHTAERIEAIKLIQALQCGDEKPGWVILRALRFMEQSRPNEAEIDQATMTVHWLADFINNTTSYEDAFNKAIALLSRPA